MALLARCGDNLHILNVKFLPGADYPEEDQHFAAELFYNFLDNKDFVYKKPFTQFHVGVSSLGKKENTFNEIIGKPGLSLSFIGESKCSLLGAEFDLYQTNVLVDMTLDKIVFDDDKQGAELYISDAPNTEFKMIKRYYRTKEEAQEGRTRIYNEYATYKMEDSETAIEPMISNEEFEREFQKE